MKKKQFLKVIPNSTGEGPQTSNGTKVITEDGVEIQGITKINITAEVGEPWKAQIELMLIPSEFIIETTNLSTISREYIKASTDVN